MGSSGSKHPLRHLMSQGTGTCRRYLLSLVQCPGERLQLLGWMLCCLLPVSYACLGKESMNAGVCSSHIWNALKSPCTLTSCQGTQEGLQGQLPAAASLTTWCELIPQHLPATSPGTLQL